MNQTVKLIIGIIVVVIIAWIGYGLVVKKETAPTGTFKIGSILPLSGDFALLGEEIRRGAEIAVEELRAERIKIEYVGEDDRFEVSQMANAANKLVRADRIDAAFTATVQEAKPVTPIFNENKIPFLVTWDSNEFLKKAGDYVFSIGFSTEAAGEKMANYAYKTLNLRSIAIIHHIDEWSDLISTAFENKFKKLGGSIVMREKTLVTETDYRTLLSKTKQVKADAIYFPMVPLVKSVFLIQAKQLGITAALLTGDGFLQDEINEAGSAAENVYFTNIYADSADGLTQKYKEKYGSGPGDIVFVSFGYDGVKVLVEARRIGQENDLSLREALMRVKLAGAEAPIDMNGTQYSERLEKVYKVVSKTPVLVEE